MPIMVFFGSIMLGVTCFGLILCAIEESPIYWIPAIFIGFLAVANFLKFLAMC